jgi:hypothetical protein
MRVNLAYRWFCGLSIMEWPADQLRLVVERWQPAAEVRIEPIC